MRLASGLMNTLREETSSLVEHLRQSVVVIHSTAGHGSGLIWDSEGLIVTNDHVLTSSHVEAELFDGRRLAAQVIAHDPFNDLAALSIREKSLPAARIGDSRTLRVGELIPCGRPPLRRARQYHVRYRQRDREFRLEWANAARITVGGSSTGTG